jgi:hypothetical protein
MAHPGEVAELDQLGGRFIVSLQFSERNVEVKRQVRTIKGVRRKVVEVEPLERAAGLERRPSPGAVDQDAARRFRGRLEEVGAAMPGTAGVVPDQPEVRFAARPWLTVERDAASP